MRRFIHRENVRHLEGLLQQPTNDARRQCLLRLLEEEKASLLEAESEAAHPPAKAADAE